MHFFLIALTILLQACTGLGGKRAPAPWLSGPPALRVDFDSIEAAAHLTWEGAPRRGFLRYEIQRSVGGDFAPLAVVEAIEDTTLADEGLRGNAAYRYRVMTYFGGEEGEHALASTTVEGGIHRHANAWRVGDGSFMPTRLVVDRRGTVAVVGAGSGHLMRFDRAGNPLSDLPFTGEPLACLETGILDGPSLALDSDNFLYVTYNVRREGSRPQAFWNKYDADGQLIWARPLGGLFARHIAIDAEDRIFIESISQLRQFDRDGERQKQYIVPALLVSSLRFWAGRFAALIEPLSLVEGDWRASRLVVYDDVDRQTSDLVIGRDPASPQDRGNGLLLRPTDFSVDEGAARAFVINGGMGRVEVFREDRFLTRWGEEGSGAGQFRFAGRATVLDDVEMGTVTERSVVAGGIARDEEGYIYVADTFNHRIQKFQP